MVRVPQQRTSEDKWSGYLQAVHTSCSQTNVKALTGNSALILTRKNHTMPSPYLDPLSPTQSSSQLTSITSNASITIKFTEFTCTSSNVQAYFNCCYHFILLTDSCPIQNIKHLLTVWSIRGKVTIIVQYFHHHDICETRFSMLCTSCLELTTANCSQQ